MQTEANVFVMGINIPKLIRLFCVLRSDKDNTNALMCVLRANRTRGVGGGGGGGGKREVLEEFRHERRLLKKKMSNFRGS